MTDAVALGIGKNPRGDERIWGADVLGHMETSGSCRAAVEDQQLHAQ